MPGNRLISIDRGGIKNRVQSAKTQSGHWLKRFGMTFVVALIAGVIGGMIAIYLVNHYGTLKTDSSRSVVLQESSAIIDVVKRVGPSVVSINTESVSTDFFGRPLAQAAAGSGIIISSDGLILTNKHVIKGANQITVVTAGDQRIFKNAKIVGEDPINDIAFIKVNAHDLPAAELGDSDQVVVGQRVVAIGNALGEFQNTVTSGIISGVGRPLVAGGLTEAERLQDLLQTDAAINPGNSGGPLVNVEGQVIGIDTAVAGNAENIGFAIPINQAKADITSIDRAGKLLKAFLGVRYIDINQNVKERYHLPLDEGAFVIGSSGQPPVLPNSPAATAGIQNRDIITKVDNQAVTNTRSLTTLIGQHQPGDKVVLTILRDGKEIQPEVTLGELPTSQ